MRILRDDKYSAILSAARDEFVGKGFKDASMRNIARNANVGVSNIYNYFRSKDEMFLAVVNPARNSIYKFVDEQHSEQTVDIKRLSTFDCQLEAIERYIGLLEKYREEFRLLLFRSEGSSMCNFRDNLTDYLTRVSNNHMELVKQHYPHVNKISPFFIHALSAFMVSIVGEIITHNLDKQKIREFFREYFKFEIAGWCELIGV